MTKLRECPFCLQNTLMLDSFGVTADGHATDWRVTHTDNAPCQAWGPECPTREEAIAAWNTRPGDRAAAEAMREAAAKEVECGCTNAAEFLAMMLKSGPHWGGDRWRLCGRDPCGTELAHWIRSLPLPGDET